MNGYIWYKTLYFVPSYLNFAKFSVVYQVIRVTLIQSLVLSFHRPFGGLCTFVL